MKRTHANRYYRHGNLIAEVDIELREREDKAWSPTIDLNTMRKLERVRKALESDRLDEVRAEARLFRLEPA